MAPVVLEGWLWFFYVQCAYNHMREPERGPEGERPYGIAQSWPDAHDEDGNLFSLNGFCDCSLPVVAVVNRTAHARGFANWTAVWDAKVCSGRPGRPLRAMRQHA